MQNLTIKCIKSRILACGELVSKWDTSVRSICFQCNEIDSISHLLYECKLAKQTRHIVNRSLLVNILLEDIVFGTKLTSDLNYAVSLVSFCIYKHWILNHMNIKDRTYSSILIFIFAVKFFVVPKNTHIVIQLSRF